MEEIFQFIAVNVPHPMEIAGSEPIGVEDLLRSWTTDTVQEQPFELVVRETVFGTGTDVVIVIPKGFGHFRTADAFEQSTTVFDGSPFEYTTDRHMEHDRVVVLEDRRIEDTGLTERCPGLDTGIGDDPFRLRFGQSVMIVCRDTDRIPCSTPMEGFPTIAHLGYRTDIDHFRLLVFRLREHRFGDIFGCGDVGAQGCLRTIIRLRRHHSTYMEHDIGTRHAFEDILVFGEVTPDNGER